MAEYHSQNRRLSITREAELLQSFVRINVREDENETKEKEIKPELQEHLKDPTEDTGKKKEREGSFKEPKEAPSEEIKKKVRKKRKRCSKREEVYCDKDRAAAAAMGSKDIKHSLRLKRKQDRSKALQIPEEAEPSTFLALGNYEMARGDLKIALDFMNKALELNPVEKNALVARSKCYILLGKSELALKDAETALSIDKHFLKAIYQKAEALYYLGDFEHSLVYFHRGLHIRPDHNDFKLGVHKAQKAIENAIGSPNVFGKAASGTSSSTPKSSSSSRTKSGRKSRLLRELGPDKDYLDKLMKNPNLRSKFNADDTKIVKTIEETVEYLNARQEFWRQQLPAHYK